VFLIAHPTKMRKDDKGQYAIPSLYDVKGSGDFRDQAHNGLCIHRYFDENNEIGAPHTLVVNLKTKFKHQGNIGGSSQFEFTPEIGRYKIFGDGADLSAMIDTEPPKVETLPITGDELSNFDNESEIVEEEEDEYSKVPF